MGSESKDFTVTAPRHKAWVRMFRLEEGLKLLQKLLKTTFQRCRGYVRQLSKKVLN